MGAFKMDNTLIQKNNSSELLSCIILDDDQISMGIVKHFLQNHSQIKVLHSLSDSRMAIRYLAIYKPDVLFLDVEMPHKTGLEVQKEMNELNLDTEVVFTTAGEKYMIEAFKNNAFDYLVKPIHISEFNDSVNRLIKKISSKKELSINEIVKSDLKPISNKEIIIKTSESSLRLKNVDITYVQADNGYSKIHLANGKIEVLSKNIGKYESYFSPLCFYKISRSTIVNTQYVTKIDRVKSKITLSVNGQHIALKGSKDRLVDIEGLLLNKSNNIGL
jgi:DNA-binding LytR/AlgR family response regulator